VEWNHTQVKFSPYTLDTAYKPFLELFLYASHLTIGSLLGAFEEHLGVLRAWKEVDKVDYAILVDVSSLKNVGRGQVLLLGCA
jgi:hypothetical protein